MEAAIASEDLADFMRNFIKHRVGNADHNGAAMNVGIALRRLVPRLLECAGFFHDDNRRASGVAGASRPATLVRELPEEAHLKLYYKRHDYSQQRRQDNPHRAARRGVARRLGHLWTRRGGHPDRS